MGGSWVIIQGLLHLKTQNLNGQTGSIFAHPSEGHPTFICKPSSPDRPQLTFCVSLDDPTAAGQRLVLLEPRFLLLHDKYLAQVANNLDVTLSKVSGAHAVSIESTQDKTKCCSEQSEEIMP